MAKKSVKESDTKKNIKESNTKNTLKSKKKVEEKTEVDSPVVKKEKHGPYFGYGFRLGLFFVLFLLFFGAGVFALVSSIVIEDEKEIAYREVGNANYEVCYKKDDFYQGKCFSKDMNMKYIANLIDKIHLDFTYQFDIDEQENIDFTYDVIGKLIISDATSNKNYFEKEYSLIPSKKLKLENDKSARIEEDLDIDYGKYNSLANQFNKSYGVNSESKLLIYMNVHKQNQEDSSVVLNNYCFGISGRMGSPISEASRSIPRVPTEPGLLMSFPACASFSSATIAAASIWRFTSLGSLSRVVSHA